MHNPQSSDPKDNQDAEQFAQQVARLESLVKPHMTDEAWVRYTNLRVAHPHRCVQAMVHMAKFIQSGSVKTVDDAMFKRILMGLEQSKKQTNIQYR